MDSPNKLKFWCFARKKERKKSAYKRNHDKK